MDNEKNPIHITPIRILLQRKENTSLSPETQEKIKNLLRQKEETIEELTEEEKYFLGFQGRKNLENDFEKIKKSAGKEKIEQIIYTEDLSQKEIEIPENFPEKKEKITIEEYIKIAKKAYNWAHITPSEGFRRFKKWLENNGNYSSD